MATTTTTVRTATAVDVPALAATFAEAFRTDPVMVWCYPDPERRARALPAFFRIALDHIVPFGGVESVQGHVAGAIWVPPDAELDEETFVGEVLDASGVDAPRVAEAFELLGEHHPADAAHQYLFILGTRDAWQSRGLGSALLRSVTADCDRDGLGAYLEATSERNRWLYERHGFEVTRELHLPDGPPLWCMWRAPGG